MIKHIHSHDLLMNNYNATSQIPLEIEKISTSIQPMYASTPNFAKLLTPSFNGTQISFFELKSKVSYYLVYLNLTMILKEYIKLTCDHRDSNISPFS